MQTQSILKNCPFCGFENPVASNRVSFFNVELQQPEPYQRCRNISCNRFLPPINQVAKKVEIEFLPPQSRFPIIIYKTTISGVIGYALGSLLSIAPIDTIQESKSVLIFTIILLMVVIGGTTALLKSKAVNNAWLMFLGSALGIIILGLSTFVLWVIGGKYLDEITKLYIPKFQASELILSLALFGAWKPGQNIGDYLRSHNFFMSSHKKRRKNGN